MSDVDWAAFGGRILQTMAAVFIFTGLFTFIGAPVLKYFARQLSWVSAATIFFWSMFLVLCISAVADLAAELVHLTVGWLLSLLSSAAGLCAVGWLLTRHLAMHYGVPAKFPAVGAKVMATFALLVALAVWLIRNLPGHTVF